MCIQARSLMILTKDDNANTEQDNVFNIFMELLDGIIEVATNFDKEVASIISILSKHSSQNEEYAFITTHASPPSIHKDNPTDSQSKSIPSKANMDAYLVIAYPVQNEQISQQALYPLLKKKYPYVHSVIFVNDAYGKTFPNML